MDDGVRIVVNGSERTVEAGSTVAAALMAAGITVFRKSVSGEARGPLCGIGTCFECRVTIDGVPHCRSCLSLCRPGMSVVTDGG